ncbi:MAG: hypothetical protein J6Q13_00040 [Clostridia bacterium]|nr:hypothetical protein [Clostridia bacterium]
MGRTLSPEELQAGIKTFAERKQISFLAKMAEGAHVPKKGSRLISVSKILKDKTAGKSGILSLHQELEPSFEQYAGKKADTAKIFQEHIARQAENQNVASL